MEREGAQWFAELAKRDANGVLPTFDREYVEEQCLDAVEWVLAQVPAARRRLTSGRLSDRVWVKTICDVVMRKLANRDGRHTEADGVYSYTKSPVVAAGYFWLTKEDRQVLEGERATVPETLPVGFAAGWR